MARSLLLMRGEPGAVVVDQGRHADVDEIGQT